MVEATAAREGRRWVSVAVGRLRRVRWVLAAAIFGILATYLVGDGSPAFLVAALAGLLFAAVALPSGRMRSRPAPTHPDPPPARVADLSAVDLAAAVADPLIVFDRAGLVRFANQAAVAAFGDLPADMSLPLRFRAPEIQAMLETVLAGRQSSVTADYAERVPMERVFRVIVTAVGRGTGLYVIIFRDQSETLRIDRMRADFIANASHELRTPLASITGFVETLRGPARNDPAARDQFLKIMQEQTGRMARLIDDLLSLSRLEMKAAPARTSSVDLCEVMAAVVGAMEPLALETGVAIDNGLGAGPLLSVGDRDELIQVFQNLLENACKYGQSGRRVEISAVPAAGDIGIVVRDFGPGIPPEHIPRITERFYRADIETSRAHKGTGLGLSIVKHILSRHRGRLDIRSVVGQGSSFTVFLPAADAKSAADSS